eukprot:Seg2677.3 transcript_id=Seg2677.3/GoldUCD/mRNA.D3Y31 product="hypothetical protein" protein_id=Seg2677.3/GoldUCD/D3Y31
MAAASLGALTYGYRRNSIYPKENELVWVVRTSDTKEPRRTSTVPVPRHKFLYPNPAPETLANLEQEWRLQVEPPLFSYLLKRERLYPSSQATRCEEWSTLRQNLPSRGFFRRESPAKWGTGLMPVAPKSVPSCKDRFPHINSPMTTYVDDMHVSNRLFKLH